MPSGKTSYTNVMDIVVPAPPPPPRRTEATSPPEPNDPSVPPREVPPDITPEPPSDDREFERVTPDVGTIPGGGKPDVAPPPPPDPPTASKEPVRVGGEIMPPQKVKHVNPVYPPIAQSARVQGIVIIEATIGLDGRVQEARVLRSIPLLDSAALEAVREWQFTPTLLNKVPVPVVMTVTVQFSLQ
ncbi:MAG: Ferric siderophore transport system, periplasmic binding protein TonB [Parcubacteria bacterium C7867-003]|nr:MAG: Ferric siderophore transport system, periplasmic binding protein TonB [Parcubacteria bacterium C7867-003]